MDADTLERLRESFTQMLYLCSILGGFSFTVVMQLVTSDDQRRLVSALLVTYLLATALFIAATIIGALTTIWLRPSTVFTETQFYSSLDVVAVLTFTGLGLFLVGLGGAGFLHSRRIGIAALAAVLVAVSSVACGLFYTLVDYTTI